MLLWCCVKLVLLHCGIVVLLYVLCMYFGMMSLPVYAIGVFGYYFWLGIVELFSCVNVVVWYCLFFAMLSCGIAVILHWCIVVMWFCGNVVFWYYEFLLLLDRGIEVCW